jgi:hypothetical protein
MNDAFQKNDRVVLIRKNNIKARVVGHYKHTGGVIVETDAGHRWIVPPDQLEAATVDTEK